MKAWSYWLPDLMPHVPGCPQVLAEHELRRSAQAFFIQTRAWKVTESASLPVAAGQDEVTIAPSDAGQDLVRMEAAWFDGVKLTPSTATQLDADYGDDWSVHTGTPDRYIQDTPGVLRLYPIPMAAATTGLKVRLSVAPSESSTGIPDEMAVRFRDEIHVGAKSRLMLYPGKPWTNLEMAAVYGQAFNNMVAIATTAAARSFGAARIPSRVNWC